MRSSRRLLAFVAAAMMAAPLRLRGQDEAASSNPNLSRQMQLAIRYYDKGDEMQALDRFMDILTKGDPAERNMANEYINLINHRMNTGETVPAEPVSRRPNPAVAEPSVAPRAPAPAPRAAPEVLVEPAKNEVAAAASRAPAASVSAPVFAPAVQAPPPPQRLSAPEVPLPAGDKALMKKEIKAKIRGAVEAGLKELRAVEGVKVLMMESGDPQAVAIPSSLLFSQGIAFQKDATPILEALTKMIFGLGSAQVVILPEGTAVGDAKILDMRRTMGISANFFSTGIAPARVRVNLLNAQVDIPRPLLDFRGIVLLFVYNQPLNLVVDSSIGEEGGPPISLGIYPTAFRAERAEGAVIEFSVQDPPAGLVSWKFQLLQPTAGDVRDLAPLQDVVGGSPVFHQIYWNGRQNYFGPALPAGRYECVLTATDAKNRQRTLHRWISLIDSSGGLGAPAASAAAPRTVPTGAAGPPATDLSVGAAKSATLIKEARKFSAVEIKKGGASSARKGRRKKKPAPAVSEPKPDEAGASEAPAAAAPAAKAEDKPTKPSSGNFELAFAQNTHQLSADAEKKLAQVHETLVYYPMENLKIVGYAQSSETDAAGLADRRAQMVASLLINKYQVEPKKIQVTSTVVATPTHKVEIDFVKNE
ncbi:MAG: OmpA family protein [Elusimicrobia bacterium]|nr:OmpA family protein [Elusimicrobiota bacterium]